MKYIVGASIGGLFGFGVPMMVDLDIQNINSESPRIEDSQPVEDFQPINPSEGFQHLPDDLCRYIKFKSDDLKEQAKECLSVDIPAVPAI
jgi:hypothetical protein